MREAQASHWSVGVHRGDVTFRHAHVVSEGLQQALTLREGKAPVMESGHVVVSGWSPIVPALVSELCSREKEVGGTVVVLLTELPKTDVENVLREHINFSNSHVVVRAIRPRPKIWKRSL